MLIELLHSQYILDSQKLYVYRAVVVALSIVFYNVFNSSLLYGPSCCQAGARVFQLLSSGYIAAANTARTRRQHAGGRRGASITKSARGQKEQLALLSCCRVLLLRKLSVIVYIPCQAEQFAASTFDTCARAIAHELKRVPARAASAGRSVLDRQGH